MLLRTCQVRKGYTLLELLTVVTLLGILAAAAVPQFSGATASAREAVAKSASAVADRITLYRLEHGDRLPDLASASAAGEHFKPLTEASTYGNSRRGPYLASAPVNPATGGSVVMNVVSMEPTGLPTAVPGADFIYDYGGGSGSGFLWRTTDRATGAPARQ